MALEPLPSRIALDVSVVSAALALASAVKSATAAVPLPVKYGTLSAALVRPARAVSSASRGW